MSMGQDKRAAVPAGMAVGEGLQRGVVVPKREMAVDEDLQQPRHHGNNALPIKKEEYPKEAVAKETKGVAVAGDSVRGAAWGNENNPLPFWRPTYRAAPAIANPSPPSTYGRPPYRSRKQTHPTRFIAVDVQQGVDMMEGQGSTVTFSATEMDGPVDDDSSSDDADSAMAARRNASAAASTSAPTPYRRSAGSRTRRKRRRAPRH